MLAAIDLAVHAMAEGGSRVMAGSQLAVQLSRFPADLLDRPCTESHMGKVAQCIDLETMLIMAAELELDNVQVKDIRDSYPLMPVIQRLEMLKRSQTTYRCVHYASFFMSAEFSWHVMG